MNSLQLKWRYGKPESTQKVRKKTCVTVNSISEVITRFQLFLFWFLFFYLLTHVPDFLPLDHHFVRIILSTLFKLPQQKKDMATKPCSHGI